MKNFLCLLLVKIFIIDFCFADIIILKDGQRIDGEIITDTPDQICIKTEKKSFFILKENIEKIILESNKNNKDSNWFVIGIASGLIITFILVFLIAKAGNTY